MSLGECIACQGGVEPILIYKANSGLGYVPTRQNGRVGGTMILMIQGSWSLGQFPRSPQVPPPACRNTLIVANRWPMLHGTCPQTEIAVNCNSTSYMAFVTELFLTSYRILGVGGCHWTSVSLWAFVAPFGIKIALDYWPKKSKNARFYRWVWRTKFDFRGFMSTFGIRITLENRPK